MTDETKGKLSLAVAGGFTLLGVVLTVGIVFLTDDGKTAHCSNATDPGVHVDQ